MAQPGGAVILVVDGLGASYVYPEHRAYALDGSPIDGAVLFNLTGGGARAVDVRVPVPETTKSHSVLITGNSGTDPDHLGPTIFDAARANGYLCLAVLERGDSMPVLQEMDGVLYLGDNALHGAEPIPGFRAGAPAGPEIPISGVAGQVCPVLCAPGRSGLRRLQCLGSGRRRRTSSRTSPASTFSCW